MVRDSFDGDGHHDLEVPYHFVENAELSEFETGKWRIQVAGEKFDLIYSDADDWNVRVEEGWISRSYGQKSSRPVLRFSRSGDLAPLTVAIYPAAQSPDRPEDWLADVITDSYLNSD